MCLLAGAMEVVRESPGVVMPGSNLCIQRSQSVQIRETICPSASSVDSCSAMIFGPQLELPCDLLRAWTPNLEPHSDSGLKHFNVL